MLIPRRKITIESAKSAEDILRTLKSMTDDCTSFYKVKDKTKLFYGHIEAPKFIIHSTPEEYLRGILLQLNVEIRQGESGVTVDLDVRPWLYERVLATIYYSFCAFILIIGFFNQKPLAVLIPVILLVFCFLLTRFTFIYLYNKLVSILTETLS